MDIPKKIKVGPYDYKIVVEGLHWYEQHGKYGDCHDDKRQISIVEMDDHTTIDTLLHEVLHACYLVMDIKDKDTEETTVTRLGTALTMVFRDNPKLVELLGDLYGESS